MTTKVMVSFPDEFLAEADRVAKKERCSRSELLREAIRKKDPLRPLTDKEREVLEQLSRAQSEPASHVARAKAVLAVADGQDYTAAARAAGRRSGDAVSQLVSRFNREGLAAIAPRHGEVLQSSTGWRNASAFWPNSSVSPTARRAERPPGR